MSIQIGMLYNEQGVNDNQGFTWIFFLMLIGINSWFILHALGKIAIEFIKK